MRTDLLYACLCTIYSQVHLYRCVFADELCVNRQHTYLFAIMSPIQLLRQVAASTSETRIIRDKTTPGPEPDRIHSTRLPHVDRMRTAASSHTKRIRAAAVPHACLQLPRLPRPNRVRPAPSNAGGVRPVGFTCGATRVPHEQSTRPRLFWVQGPVRNACFGVVDAPEFATSGPHANHSEFLVGIVVFL